MTAKSPCGHCGLRHETTYYFESLTNPVAFAGCGESTDLCRDCCIETDNAPEGYGFSRNCLTDRKIMLDAYSINKPHLDPRFETYHCM